MKPTTPDMIRNVALISHGGAGKTSLAEAMLFDAGAISRLGSVEAGTTALDWDPDEHRRGQSINLAVGSLEHDGVRVTIVDTPGYADFQADVAEALAAVDAVIVVVDASAGVEVGTDEVWRLADARRLPRMVFVNKMDRENANYDTTLDQLKARFGPKIAPVYLPIGSAESFRGYVDVIEEHASVYENGQPTEVPIPPELEGIEHSRRDALVEAAAEASDELMMKYLEGEAFTDEEIESALHKGTREGIGRAGLRRVGDEEHRRPRADEDDRQAHPLARRGRHALHGRRQGDQAGPERAVRRPGLQGRRRPVRRPPDLLPCPQRHALGAGPCLQREPKAGGAGRNVPRGPGQGPGQPREDRPRRHRRGRQADLDRRR